MKNSKIDRYINSQQVTTHMQGCEQHYDKSCHTTNISRRNMKNTCSAIQTYCVNTTNPNPGNNITIHPPKTVPMTTMYIYHPKHMTHTHTHTHTYIHIHTHSHTQTHTPSHTHTQSSKIMKKYISIGVLFNQLKLQASRLLV